MFFISIEMDGVWVGLESSFLVVFHFTQPILRWNAALVGPLTLEGNVRVGVCHLGVYQFAEVPKATVT